MAAQNSTPATRPLLVLGKISEILDAFSLAQPSLTVSEIRQATGFPTSTLQRLVTNMVAQGFLDRDGDRLRIGVRMAYWASPAAAGVDVLDIVAPVLADLRDDTGETTCFFRVEQLYRVCVAMAETRHALRRQMNVGKVLPLHAGSAGRVLLAWNPSLMDQVRESSLAPITEVTITNTGTLDEAVKRARIDGFAITTGEREDGSSGLSAPVFDSATEVIGAMTISGPSMRMPLAQCESWVESLLRATDQVTRMLGGRYPDGGSIL